MGRPGPGVTVKRTLLRDAHVITMAPDRPDAKRIDVLVEDGHIADIGDHLDAGDAEIVDLSGRIVMPGLVNAPADALLGSRSRRDGPHTERYVRWN